MAKTNITNVVKLTSNALDNITERLQSLVSGNANVSTLAYAGVTNSGPRCGCKGSCDGGCTSW